MFPSGWCVRLHCRAPPHSCLHIVPLHGLDGRFLLQAFLVYPDVQVAAARSEEGRLMAFSAGSAQVDAASAMLPRLIPFAEHWEQLLSQGGHLSTAPGMHCMA